MLARILSIVGLVSAGLLLILTTTTTPSSAGAFGILAVFVLIYVTILTFLTFVLWLVAKLTNRLSRQLKLSKTPKNMNLKKSYYYASVLALGPVILISLQAVGGIGFYDIGLVIVFLGLGCLYVSRRTS